ncbi:MAG: 2-oxoacid:acceptor oxidoreductase subunit alpha [Gemmatimonadetes bacterium]|nr:2-oxoacid:acceptor oxidoreductase subunit alpha [Gemmatimonadota bacterium]MYH17751.1 2-oxoacid:acceptor oxidoreductase subunit alpha [Gemmatimonadota bacterium]MYK98030.1 2-oxoacid:acceptor oxidoreductase subunit alpha [Gemmatimonadota bacterium]
MDQLDLTIRIAGENGEGVLTVGDVLAEALARSGLHIYTFKNLPAEIKGGASMTQVRVQDTPVRSPGDALDILMVWNQENYDIHVGEVKPTGVVIYDPDECDADESLALTQIGVPLQTITKTVIKTMKSKNVLAFGILTACLGIPFDSAKQMVSESRWGRRKEFLESNINALKQAYVYVDENGIDLGLRVAVERKNGHAQLIMTGNDALCMGALAAGCRYYAGYPITPASDVMETLAKAMPRVGGVLMQTEDEIAAITASIGASFTGAKVMTATAGPGLSLMVEALGLATMEEIPLVVVDVQRGGPSTGMPTKTEQSDLNLAIHGAHGEAPRIVIAATNTEDCFYTAVKAFNLAEKYQTPVILLSDQHLSQRAQVMSRPDLSQVEIVERKQPELNGSVTPEEFDRYEMTEDFVSPMPLPGRHDQHYVATGLEHDEHAHIDYSPEAHIRMTEKRHQKIESAVNEPGFVQRYGAEDAQLGLIGWGSSEGPILEALDRTLAKGYKVAALIFKMLHPLPEKEARAFIESIPVVSVVELNASGQFANYLQGRLAVSLQRFNIITGLPFKAGDIEEYIEGVLQYG